MSVGRSVPWLGKAALAALALACVEAGGETPAPGRAEAEPAGPGRKPARVVTEVAATPTGNRPPRFLTSAPRAAWEGRRYAYELAASDPDGDAVTFSLLRAPEGAVLEGEVLKWTPTPGQAGHLQRFTLRAVDVHGAERLQHWSVLPGRAQPKGPLAGPRTRH